MTRKDNNVIIITCEHASNDIPKEYHDAFANKSRILNTHAGYDIGASQVAMFLAKQLKCKLVMGNYSRLLVDLNRSAHHHQVFSKYSKQLSQAQRCKILRTIYEPYRNKVIAAIKTYIKQNVRVCHLSVHSFTPVLKKQKRNADLAFLYSTNRPLEKAFAQDLKKIFNLSSPNLKIRRNYPYKGDSDGFTKTLRGLFPSNQYLGIEIEMNQKIFKNKTKSNDLQWQIYDAITLYHKT